MAFEEDILKHQLEHDAYNGQDNKVSGIAKLAIDKGFNSLSAAQNQY